MRFSTIFAAVAAIATTGAAAVSADALLAELTKLNLTSLVGAAVSIQNTTAGKSLLTTLTSGETLTILAPNNAAFTGINPFFANDPHWLGQALAYHVITGKAVSTASIPTDPNSVVYTTALTDTSLVHLGGKAQSITLTKVANVTYVANQNSPSTVYKSVTFQNINILFISSVIDLPPSFAAAISDPSQTWAPQFTSLAPLIPASLSSLLSTTPSVTIFAPNNDAIADALAHGRISSSTNATEIHDLLLNHVIEGTVVFTGSPQTNYVSAGGQDITVGTGGAFGNVVYYKGELVADIVHGNVIIQNGVLHVIDRVLPNFATKSTKRALVSSRFFGKRQI